MISFIKGVVCEINADSAVIEQGGIGFLVYVPASELNALSVNTEIRLYTYLRVAEDDLSLYGFLTRDTLQLFTMLISVNGIGPKGAMAILSVLSADDLRFAIASEDAKAISRAPGIGNKTAQRVILDLRDKIDYAGAMETRLDQGASAAAAAAPGTPQQEAIQALVALGYGSAEAMRAVRSLDSQDMDVEEILKAALRNLAF